IAFDDNVCILLKQEDSWDWFRTSDCFWSEADTTELNSSLKQCYPDLKDFFLGKLGIKISAYDELLNVSSDDPDVITKIIFSLRDEVGDSIPNFPPEPIQKAKIFPVRYPDENISLCSLDTEFAIADREHLGREMQGHIKILDFDLGEVRRLWALFEWLDIEDRYLSRCVNERVTIIDDYKLHLESELWDLKRKAYHIARVAATFGTYGTYSDAQLLFQRLQKLRVVEVSKISSELAMIQDGHEIRSPSKPTVAHISDSNINFTIYVPKDKTAQQLCAFSVLPRMLEKWLRQDLYPWHTSEAVNSLTSIIASDISFLDEILEDQGIIQLPFEESDIRVTEIATEGTPDRTSTQKSTQKVDVPATGEDQGKALVLRERDSAPELEDKDASQ
ncbi:hypothetical protein IL306_002787, partial [Fusarium sp. DS 682]